MSMENHKIDQKSTGNSPGNKIRARCGFLCSSCQAYKGNIHDEQDRERVHHAWKKIYGLDIPREALCCDGCLMPDSEDPFRIGGDCKIRSCVLEKGIEHCGYCDGFPCDLMESHLSSVEKAEPVRNGEVTDEEFRDFIDPYLCRKFLDTVQNR